MDMQHSHTDINMDMDHVAWICRMGKQRGQATRIFSMDMQCRCSIKYNMDMPWTRTCSMEMDMQDGHGHAAWTQTSGMKMDIQHRHRHAAWT
jgi:hypothetical protein